MSNFPNDLRYTGTHEWVRDEGDNTYSIGITDHAQQLLGDLVYVDLPEAGAGFGSGDEIGVVESVKAAADVYIPLEGVVLEVNPRLENEPELVNQDPYGDGWLFKFKLADGVDAGVLLDAADYQAKLSDK